MESRTLVGRYVLGQPLGQGGMGVVHRAFDRELERDVAIKLLWESGAQDKARFKSEARRTASLRHPSIIEVFDIGEDDGATFFVMELLVGETLADRLRRGPLEVVEAETLAEQLCEALAVAHEAGVVHRDVKPANVFLVEAPSSRAKLLDFGIAKELDRTTLETRADVILGTLSYMAPEQILGTTLDGRADLYALGLTLYHALTGHRAFEGANAATAIHEQLTVAPVSMRQRAPERNLPEWLDALVLSMVEKEPERRPASARDVVRSLKARARPPREEPRGATPPVLLDEEPNGAPIELADVSRPAVATLAPVQGLAAPLRELATAEPSERAWLAPLAWISPSIGKRLAFYSLFAIGIGVVFFNAGLFWIVALLVIAAVGMGSLLVQRSP